MALWHFMSYVFYINVREYRRANQIGQSRDTGNIGYTRRRKTKHKHNTTCTGHRYTQTNTTIGNKTCSLLQTTRGKDEPNIVFMWKSQRTPQYGMEHKTQSHTIGQHKKLNRGGNTDPTKNKYRMWTQVLAKGNQFLLLIRHPLCYSYIQSSPSEG